MQIYADALREGWSLLVSDAAGVWQVVVTSLAVSGTATLIALAIGLPFGVMLGAGRFIGRRAALLIFNTGMGLPPVAVGLVVAMTLSRRGPLGDLSLLYSKTAMVLAQLIIALPIIVAVSAAAVGSVPRELQLQARSLGASRLRVGVLTLAEARLGLFAAVAGGFGAIISEVGAVQMVGGNLAGDTRVMTTAIVQYTRMGRYGQALALAIVLVGIVLFVNIWLTSAQTSAQRWERRQ
ncbi:MAG: ABC transporter permease [Coriobacteriales bacterium]|nr:ABC transporter permease [Coriobacteriales bacterium]